MESNAVEYIRQKGVAHIIESLLSQVVKAQPPRPAEFIGLLPVLPIVSTAWPETLTATPEERESVHTLNFNVFPMYENPVHHGKLLILLEYMFQTLGAQARFGVRDYTLRNFILRVYEAYDDTVPFHNFRHAFNVAQTFFVFVTSQGVKDVLTPLEQFAGLVAALCHDLGHPGTNNAFQVATESPYAIRYNNLSVLENYHSAYAFHILQQENLMESHAVKNPQDAKRFRELIIACILATDISCHKQLFESIPTTPDFTNNPDHRKAALTLLVECSDISNEIRSHSFSQLWAPLVQEEFYRQGDLENELKIPSRPMFQRGATQLATEQIGFITYVCLKPYGMLAALFPSMQVHVDQLNKNIEAWKAMEKKK